MVHVVRIVGSGIMISYRLKDKVRHQRRQRSSHDANQHMYRINNLTYLYFVVYIMNFRLTSYMEWLVILALCAK